MAEIWDRPMVAGMAPGPAFVAGQVPGGQSFEVGGVPQASADQIFDALHMASQRALAAERQQAELAAVEEQKRVRDIAAKAATAAALHGTIKSLGLDPKTQAQVGAQAMKSLFTPKPMPGMIEPTTVGGVQGIKVTQPTGHVSFQRAPAPPVKFSPPGIVDRGGFPGMEQTNLITGQIVRRSLPSETPDQKRTAAEQAANRKLLRDELKRLEPLLPLPGEPPAKSEGIRAEDERNLKRAEELRKMLAGEGASQPSDDNEAGMEDETDTGPVSPVGTPASAAPATPPVKRMVFRRDPKTGHLVPSK